ncbi:MAG: uncharacterized protein KVP18_000930 [Porospora cf. gigantea A]|uniref:uncharacterized protein n=1 Tax=Porospora cf. gigantea A TaxID=2853593 RepID=UPI003559EBF6|nr:MAG: hypothetical protein KVP18_000930 [Porospora cf. gigantea A]
MTLRLVAQAKIDLFRRQNGPSAKGRFTPTRRKMGVIKNFVETGRLALIHYGEHIDKVAVITDIVTLNRVILDGPTTGVPRTVVPLRRVTLLDFKIDIPRGVTTKVLKAKLEKSDIVDQFNATKPGRELAARLFRDDLNDFERFKLRQAIYKVNAAARANVSA